MLLSPIHQRSKITVLEGKDILLCGTTGVQASRQDVGKGLQINGGESLCDRHEQSLVVRKLNPQEIIVKYVKPN